MSSRLYNVINEVVTRLKALESNAVVETGTTTAGSVTWKYKKYADKTVEMWGSGTTSLAISTASGSIYTTANDYDIAMPSFISGTDMVTAEISGGGWADITSFAVPPKLRLYAPTSYGSSDRSLRYYFRGTYL